MSLTLTEVDHFERLEDEIDKEQRTQAINVSNAEQSSVAKFLLIAQFAPVFLATAAIAVLKICRVAYLLVYVSIVFLLLYVSVSYYYDDLVELTFLLQDKYGIKLP
jgi:hypothetical protein